ncbi:MAG: cyclase family protein, partial [Actinomycetota bacterium]
MTGIWDISLPIEPGMMIWPGDPVVSVEPVARVASGDDANVSALRFSTHTGTHVDPPSHFFDGATSAGDLALEVLIGEAVVVDIACPSGLIEVPDLEAAALDGATRVLFKTANSARHLLDGAFPASYVALSAEAASWLVDRGVRLVGIDFLSVEQAHAPGHPTHVALLEAGVVIVEGLD